jgi:predicted nucleic acid-binding Zn finger protein
MPENKDESSTEGLTTKREVLASILRKRILARAEVASGDEQWLVGMLRLVRVQRFPVELWVALGKESDYILVPYMFCSCPHFTIRVTGGVNLEPCYHLVATHIALSTGRFHDLSEALSPDDVEAILLEILTYGRSTLLRKVLYRIKGEDGNG